jgi:UDP-N-acetylglucosamine 1-carboxyvinyltransferase
MSQKFRIEGGIPLKGQIRIAPSKNALLPLLASTLLTRDIVIIPITNLIDTRSKISLLEHVGYKVDLHTNEIIINPSEILNTNLPAALVGSIRSSILFLGPLLALTGQVSLNVPGGDNLQRSFDFHIQCLQQMGAIINIEENIIHAHLPFKKKLTGTTYAFVKPSVGATQHMILTALMCAKGSITILNNCSQEPECMFLINVLKEKFKADIKKQGTQITIVGNGDRFCTNKKHEITLIEDRIEALTYLSLALITEGDITLDCKNLLACVGGTDLNLLVNIGGKLTIYDNLTRMEKIPGKLQCIKYFQSGEYPEVSTDFAPILCSLLGVAEGTSIFTETVHKERFKYIEEMNKVGGSFTLHKHKPNTIVINGSEYLPSNDGICTDIRGGMALVMAALRCKGVSIIHGVHHIFRGYEHFIEKVNSLGGKIELIED